MYQDHPSHPQSPASTPPPVPPPPIPPPPPPPPPDIVPATGTAFGGGRDDDDDDDHHYHQHHYSYNAGSLEHQSLLGTTATTPTNYPPSYQHSNHNNNNHNNNNRDARLLDRPKIQNFDDDTSRGGLFGSANKFLNPNIGLTNSYDEALFGLALHQVLHYLTLTWIIISTLTLVLVMSTWFFRLFNLRSLILSAYLAFFCFLLLLSRLVAVWNKYVHKGTWSQWEYWLRYNFGFLYHPIYNTFFLLIVATLCWSMEGMWELMFGCLFLFSAIILLCLYCSNPEYRNLAYAEQEHVLMVVADGIAGGRTVSDSSRKNGSSITSSSASWSEYSTSLVTSALLATKTTTSSSRSSTGSAYHQ